MAKLARKNPLEALLAQASGNFGGKIPEIAGPSPALYGVYGSAEAGALQAAAADPYFGAGDLSILGQKANNEMRVYEDALRDQQAASLKAQDTAGYYGLQGQILEKEPDGLIGMRDARINPATGRYGVFNDPVMASVSNADALNTSAAEAYGVKAAGVKAGAEAGHVMTPEQYGVFMRNPTESIDTAPKYMSGMTPSAATDRYEASEGMTVEQQFSLEELKQAGALERAMAGATAGNGKWKAVYNPDDPEATVYTFTGTPEEMRSQGLRGPPNPNAGVSGAGTSATQGTNAFTRNKLTSGKGMRNDPLGKGRREHKGEDYRGKLGDPYNAQKDGVVVAVGAKKGFGPNVVTVRYDDGEEVFYGHGQKAYVTAGQRVKAGQAIGAIGSEGRSTGPHVHRQVVRQANAAPTTVPGTNTTKITAIMKRAQDRGGTYAIQGNMIVVTAPDGRSRTYDANGNQVK